MSIETFIQEEEFFHHFQPIYYLDSWRRVGYEVLLRSEAYSNPQAAFLEAKKAKQLYELDSRSICKAVQTFKKEATGQTERTLFLNIFPSTILNENFPQLLNKIINKNYLENQQIVLEVSESEVIENFDAFKARIKELKEHGFLIAVDDVGQGYSNFKAIIELKPNYLKLDRYFAQNLYLSKQKQRLITFFLNYCDQEKIQVVLEGLEDAKDLAISKALGINLGQGFILGRPTLLKASM